MNRDKMIEEMAEADQLCPRFTVRCDDCGTEDEIAAVDNEDAAEDFYDWGWRLIDDKMLCTSCAKKVRKQKKTTGR